MLRDHAGGPRPARRRCNATGWGQKTDTCPLLLDLGLQHQSELVNNVLALADNHTVSEGPELAQNDHIGLHLQGGALRVYLYREVSNWGTCRT